ncbi:hypothetical protein [Stappia sp. WLB 29]|uniref:hypothetical protein n=1 Tax=Stappia sp. WLB 29 TaxID=2925220 RepID=UPI0020BDFA85|nr:hypothetical protein [Stappia sp. WLB 29]
MTLSMDLITQLSAVYSGDNDFGGPRFTPVMEKRLSLTNGTGVNQADLPYFKERTVASGGTDDIDLAGALADVYGTTIDAAELVIFYLINQPRSGAANTTALTIGGGSNPFLGFLGGTAPTLGPIAPGGGVVLFAGAAAGLGTVTAGTGDIIRIANGSGAANTYQIALAARSA